MKEVLQRRGLRATRHRLRIYEVLHAASRPLSIVSIIERLGTARIDHVTVYRTLEAFERAGMAARVEFGKGRAFFELALRDHHHHLVCDSCGDVEDVHVPHRTLEQQALRGSRRFSSISSHTMEFFGTCAKCA